MESTTDASVEKDAIIKYLKDMERRIDVRMALMVRAKSLQYFTTFFHIALILYLLFSDIPFTKVDLITDVSFLVFLVTTFRALYIGTRTTNKLSEYLGAVRALKILGIISEKETPNEPEVKTTKKAGILKRFKEFAERMVEVKKEHYA